MYTGIFIGVLVGVTLTTISNAKRKKEYEEKQKRLKFKTELKLNEPQKLAEIIRPEELDVKAPKKTKKSKKNVVK